MCATPRARAVARLCYISLREIVAEADSPHGGEDMPPQKVPDLSRVEMAVLATLVSKERYGLEIRNTMQSLGQPVSLAGLYTTVARLEKQGLVTSHWGDEKVEIRQGA